MTDSELAILKTVVYADLFDYPLRPDELCEGLFDVRLCPAEVRTLLDGSQSLRVAVEEQEGFVFLRGRAAVIEARREAERRTRRLLTRHERVLGLVARLPYVRLLALSGAAAFDNVHDDDVDLFIITAQRRAWSVCLMVTLLSRVLGVRRTV